MDLRDQVINGDPTKEVKTSLKMMIGGGVERKKNISQVLKSSMLGKWVLLDESKYKIIAAVTPKSTGKTCKSILEKQGVMQERKGESVPSPISMLAQ